MAKDCKPFDYDILLAMAKDCKPFDHDILFAMAKDCKPFDYDILLAMAKDCKPFDHDILFAMAKDCKPFDYDILLAMAKDCKCASTFAHNDFAVDGPGVQLTFCGAGQTFKSSTCIKIMGVSGSFCMPTVWPVACRTTY